MPKPLKREDLDHLGSLITIKGQNQCLGDLMYFAGHGVYEPTYGRVDVTEEEAKLHNAALDKAMVEGLDQNCQIGQGSYAYRNSAGGVSTWHGTVLASAADTTIKKSKITFTRQGKTYVGKLSRDQDCFNFTRVS